MSTEGVNRNIASVCGAFCISCTGGQVYGVPQVLLNILPSRWKTQADFAKTVQIAEISAVDETVCTLKSSDKVLDAVFKMCKNTVKYGTQEGYLDCPAREKGQYLGDALITAHAQVWLSGSLEMLRKCIGQFAQTSMICPGLMAVAPGAFMQEIADYSLLWPELLLLDWKFSGDEAFLSHYYQTAKGLVSHFSRFARKDGLLEQVADKWNMVDWPENLRDGYDFDLARPVAAKGCHNVVNALYLGAVLNLNKIEGILHLPLSFDACSLKESFIRVFYKKDRRLFADSEDSMHCSLHANVFPLYYQFAPKEAVGQAADFLVEKGLSCGVMLSYFYMKALAAAGRYEDIYRTLVSRTEHGWYHMLSEGASTCFEAWGKEEKWNTSLCHPWASAPIPVIIEEIAGCVPDAGYISKNPHIPESLTEFELHAPNQWQKEIDV